LLYSNRCACYLLTHQYEKGLADAVQVIRLAPTWAKVKKCIHKRRLCGVDFFFFLFLFLR
jgi:hypothetical protein